MSENRSEERTMERDEEASHGTATEVVDQDREREEEEEEPTTEYGQPSSEASTPDLPAPQAGQAEEAEPEPQAAPLAVPVGEDPTAHAQAAEATETEDKSYWSHVLADYTARLEQVQAEFIDDPRASVAKAGSLLEEAVGRLQERIRRSEEHT